MKIKNIIAGAFILTFLYALFVPVELTRYTLTDGEHTIVFQTMVHIAKPSFYNTVEADAKSYTENGYTFLFEGVLPSKAELSDTIKTGNAKKSKYYMYDVSSYMLGLTNQGRSGYYNAIANLRNTFDADVDFDWINEQFKKANIISNNPLKSESDADLDKEISEIDAHRSLYAAISLPLFRVGYRVGLLHDCFNELNQSYSPFMKIIVVKRNEVLYDNIVYVYGHLDRDKIYINYGAGHFTNFYALLKSHNSKWLIVEEKSYEAF